MLIRVRQLYQADNVSLAEYEQAKKRLCLSHI